jgi:hypothetical protein
MTMLLLALLAFSSKPDSQQMVVKAVSHRITTTQSNGRQTVCTGPVCETYGGFERIEVLQTVETGSQQYTLSCSGVPFKSAVYRYCEWLHFDGDSFIAELKGKEMIVHTRQGGNQGKQIKLKFTVTDIRTSVQGTQNIP